MSSLFLTLIIAFVLVALAIACLSIGWLITGKSKIIRGACGMDPTKARQKGCGTTIKCDLCETEEEKNLRNAHNESSKGTQEGTQKGNHDRSTQNSKSDSR